jgi:hypothetical protein
MLISLSDEEATLLGRIASQYYSDLRAEIHRTKTFEVKNQLKRDEAVLKGILDKLASASPTTE